MRATMILASIIVFAAQVFVTNAATAADLPVIPRSGPKSLAPKTAPKSPTSESLAPATVSIQGYGAQDVSCLVWTDGCRNCDRTDSGSTCSNIGIACQPGPIQCTRRKDGGK
jgi:hypothetical protein